MSDNHGPALEAVHATFTRARYADRHYPEKWRCDAWCAHLEAITRALADGATGAQVSAMQREVFR